MLQRSLIRVEIAGLDDVQAWLRDVERGAAAAADHAVIVGTNFPYAYPVHEGRFRSGRLARRAGGAFFFTRALEQVRPEIERMLAAAVPKGPRAVVLVLAAIGLRLEAVAKQFTPVRTGSLRRSIHTQMARRR